MKKYRFALDIGTNSIGYAVVGLDDGGKTIEHSDKALVEMGVRLFSDGYNPKDRVPLNQIRREARQMRRQRDRRIQRKEKILLLNQKYGLYNQDEKDQKIAEKLNPYESRKKGLDEQLTPAELGRVFFHLAVRRGFKSSRKESKEQSDSKIHHKIASLEKLIADHHARTLGEYFWKQIKDKGNRIPVRFKDGFEGTLFPSRKLLETEFDLIEKKQKAYFPHLPWDEIKEAIFYQRQLKKQERGWCLYEAGKRRAYKLQPSSHQARLWQEIMNIRLIPENVGELAISLEHKQMQQLFNEMDGGTKKNVSFKTIAKNYFKGLPGKINLENSKKALEGNITAIEMRKEECFGPIWDTLSLEQQDDIVEMIIEFNSYEDIEDEKKLDAKLSALSLSAQQKTNVKDHGLLCSSSSNKTSNLSAIAHRKFCDVYASKYLRYDEAAKEIFGHHSDKEFSNLDRLPYYGEILWKSCTGGKTQHLNKPVDPKKNPELYYGKIANPTVHIALNQIRLIINALVAKYGKPESIAMELAKDYKMNKDQKTQAHKKNKENEKLREDARNSLKAHYGNEHYEPNRDDRIRYQLFEKQKRLSLGAECPYCGKPMNISDALNGADWQIEHVLPYARYMNDSFNNKVLACREYNKNKGNRTPYEWKSGNPDEYQTMLSRISHYPESTKKLFGQKPQDEMTEEGFTERQLNDTRYICRTTMEYIQHLGLPNGVINSRGQFTARFRHFYGFNTLLGETDNKERNDHRHHAIDALVVAINDRSCFAKLVKAARKLNYDQSNLIFEKNPFKAVIKKAGLNEPPFSRERVEYMVNQILPTFKPKHKITGKFFMETAMGQIKKPVLSATSGLKKEDLQDLVSKEARDLIEELSDRHENNFEEMIKALAEEHPWVYVYRPYWVTRKNIELLEEADLVPHTDKGNYKGPVSDSLRNYLLGEVNKGRPLKEVLTEYRIRTGTKRIRYIPKGQEVYMLRKDPRPTGYALDGFAYVDVWMLPAPKDKKGQQDPSKVTYQGEFVSYVVANQKDQAVARPHPTAKKLMRLYKQDVICLQHKEYPENKTYYKVKGYSVTQNQIDLCPIHDANRKQDFRSINVVFKNYHVRKISQYLKG
ncbi:MAG: type II CRISPR RNA-guided endonuclease Cas9 [Spirochaetia bacterium]